MTVIAEWQRIVSQPEASSVLKPLFCRSTSYPDGTVYRKSVQGQLLGCFSVNPEDIYSKDY